MGTVTGVLLFFLVCGEPRHVVGFGDEIPNWTASYAQLEAKAEPWFSMFKMQMADPQVKAVMIESSTPEELRTVCKGKTT